MSTLPYILITNDDGVFAPGIKHLYQALKSFARLVVVAPINEQSAVGLSTSIRRPIRLERVKWGNDQDEIWSVTGTPSDCVKMALNIVMKSPPDLVVSGINRGSNAGRNILYSGTVAAAIESILHEIPAIAFSCKDFFDTDYSMAVPHIPTVVQYVMQHGLPQGTLLNVNFPEKSHGGIKGFKLACQGKEYWAENPDCRNHPTEGHDYYWIGAQLKQCQEKNESDIAWLNQGYMTAVPIHIDDLTDHSHLQEKKSIFEKLFPSPTKI